MLGELAKNILHKVGKIVFQNIMHLKQFQMLSHFFTSHSVITYNYVFFTSLKLESHQQMIFLLSPPQRLLFFKKPRKRGKGRKKGKAEKAREKWKSEESPPRGWLCTAMPACLAVEQRIKKMTFLNFNNQNK